MSFDIERSESSPPRRSFSKRSRGTEKPVTYDLVCVGFGTTALPLAVALADKNDHARVLFVERESQFRWQPANIMPDLPVASSFLRDLITTQNPRSSYTFMNFLYSTNQLVQFANNSRLAPTRRSMGQYFKWASEKIQQLGWVSYGQDVVGIKPTASQGNIVEWVLELQNSNTKAISSVVAKRVVLATGAQPRIPQSLAAAPLVLHSSRSEDLIGSIGSVTRPLNIAVIGADQEAAEIFEHLHTARQGRHTATLFVADSALRPEDEVSDVHDMLDRSESISGDYPPEVRQRIRKGPERSPKVDLKTIERLYEAQYTQKVHERDPSKWRFHIKAWSEVVGTERDGEKVHLNVKNPRTGKISTTAQVFDVVIAATGYTFSLDRQMIDIPTGLLETNSLDIDREYHVTFRRDILAPGCGMWLLGSLEDRDARGDNFSVMAERAQRVSRSIRKGVEAEKTERPQSRYSERAMF